MKAIVSTALAALIAAVILAAQVRTNQTKQNAEQFSPQNHIGDWPPATLGELETFSGILVDAGCRNRSAENLASPPVPLAQAAQTPEEQAAGEKQRAALGFASGQAEPQSPSESAAGITVDAKTLQQERADVLEHQVPDLLARQPDSSCAITADTRAFALLLPNGRLLDLDAGGNTYAWQLVQGLTAGRAMMNAKAGGLKVEVVAKGQIDAYILNTASLHLK